jgi:hypothetical protein
LNDGQIPNPNAVRVASGTGYHRVEGNRRASRNGPVSDLPPEIPTVTIRNFFIGHVEFLARLALPSLSSPPGQGSRCRSTAQAAAGGGAAGILSCMAVDAASNALGAMDADVASSVLGGMNATAAGAVMEQVIRASPKKVSAPN